MLRDKLKKNVALITGLYKLPFIAVLFVKHGEVPKDLLMKRFSTLKACRNQFDCLVNQMLFIRDLKPTLKVQSELICTKVFV